MAKYGPGGPGRDDLVTLNRSATVARLVAGVFHELNNSLQVIGGLTELLQDSPGLPPAVGRAAPHSRTECEGEPGYCRSDGLLSSEA